MPPPPPPQVAEVLAGRRPSALGRLLARPEIATAATVLAVVGSAVLLLGRIVPDVRGKPLWSDEVLAGLTALHSLPELLDIVLFDRGGAPLHFVLAHVALAVEPSPEALRWLSVIFALATIPLCFDLGRRLGGRVAGVTAAIVVAGSSMLAVYGSIGRMYALFGFASALAVNLFVRALQRRTGRAAFAAAVAAWLLPAVHPYGLVVVAVEGLVALGIWRGRPLRPALPVFAAALAVTPFVLADIRLGQRFGVGLGERETIAPPDFAVDQLGEALVAFAGGSGAAALAFFALALAGVFVLARRLPAFAIFAVLALTSVPLLMVLGRAEVELVHRLSPRHLMYGLPIWAALVGAGVARLVRDLPGFAPPLAIGGVAALALFAPTGIADPRVAGNATEEALSAPAAWVRAEVEPGSVLFPYSPVYLAALPATEQFYAVPRSGRPFEIVERADYPVPGVVIALPLDGTRVTEKRLRARLAPGSEVAIFDEWLLLEIRGPFSDKHAVLDAARDSLVASFWSTRRQSHAFRSDLRSGEATLCPALAELRDPCPPDLFARRQ
jgi:hypothetical protein